MMVPTKPGSSLKNRIQYEATAEHILYLVLLPAQGSGEFSPFQGFSTNLYAALDTIRYIPDWFEELLKSVEAAASISEEKVREIWLRTCYFTDTLHYVHLGTT